MYAQPGVLLGLLALAGEALSHSLAGEGARGNAANHARSARSHRRRGLPGADGAENPCKRASSGLKITDAGAASSNVTVIPATNYLHQGFGANKDKQSDGDSGSQQDSASESSQFTDRSSGTRQPLSNERLTSSYVFSSNDRVGLAPSPSSSSEDAPSSSSSQASTSGSPSSSSGKGMSTVASWSGNDFLSWDYFTYSDPTHGNVNYVSLSDAQSQNLVSLQDGRFKMAVSTGSVVNNNRNSVRISSPTNWKKGQLLVADINHIPEGCGTWPALWSIGAKRAWPAGGEIDIMEGVNDAAGNTYTLHTTAGCSMSGQSQSSGFGLTEDCQYQPGCSYKDKQDNSYGPGFNTAGGGFYASFFDDSGIKIWFWTANEAPSSIQNGSPDMSEFGTPKAFFSGSTCNMDSFFDEEQMIIINTTLMGDWAGATFWNNGCSGTLAATIADASNFDKAYWLINSVKIYSS